MNIDFKKRIEEAAGISQLKVNEPMKLHTTFRIGGPADFFIVPDNLSGLIEAIRLCKEYEVPYDIIGNGSNLLVGDKGIRGAVIQLCHTLEEVSYEQKEDGSVLVRAGAGMLLSKLAKEVAGRGLGGFEFAAGIPGTFGGAVTMNAGAYGGEIKSLILYAALLSDEGSIFTLHNQDLKLGYRTSIIQEKGYIVIEGGLILAPGDQQSIQKKIDDLASQRRAKQPLEYPSAGSTFKRPQGYFAGKLIQDAGLKGYRVGDAMVSEKHSGFVINVGSAAASDVVNLMNDVKAKVYESAGVHIEPEIRMIGEF